MWLRAEDGFVAVKTIFESIRKIIDSELSIYLELVKPCDEHQKDCPLFTWFHQIQIPIPEF